MVIRQTPTKIADFTYNIIILLSAKVNSARHFLIAYYIYHMYLISRFILKLFGWKIKGNFPPDIPKYVVIFAPHTSNWDFPLGIIARSATRADVKFIAKDSLFKPPFGFIFRWLNGYPVDRSKRHNLVDTVVNLFDKYKQFAIVIAPEGTRQKVDKFKTGFYYIAKGAGVPIILCKFDYKNKVVAFADPFYTTDDFDKDMHHIMAYYKGVVGKNPELGFL